MRVGCIIQARLESYRLPKKVIADIGGWITLKHVGERISQLGIPWVIACPAQDEKELKSAYHERSDRIEGYDIPQIGVAEDGFGIGNDVLRRYLLCARRHSYDAIMRITGDCPLIDPEECRRVLQVFDSGHYSYVANDWRQLTRVPDGLGCEVFTRLMLELADQYAKPGPDRYHVTPWIKRQCEAERTGLHLASPIIWHNPPKLSVNTEKDLDRVREIDRYLPDGPVKYSMQSTKAASDRI